MNFYDKATKLTTIYKITIMQAQMIQAIAGENDKTADTAARLLHEGYEWRLVKEMLANGILAKFVREAYQPVRS